MLVNDVVSQIVKPDLLNGRKSTVTPAVFFFNGNAVSLKTKQLAEYMNNHGCPSLKSFRIQQGLHCSRKKKYCMRDRTLMPGFH